MRHVRGHDCKPLDDPWHKELRDGHRRLSELAEQCSGGIRVQTRLLASLPFLNLAVSPTSHAKTCSLSPATLAGTPGSGKERKKEKTKLFTSEPFGKACKFSKALRLNLLPLLTTNASLEASQTEKALFARCDIRDVPTVDLGA